jgi:serine/threonine-protein kinase RsbT
MRMNYHIDGGDFVNAGKASSAVKGMLKQLNVPAPLIKKVVVALYESEVNVVAHAYMGEISVEISENEVSITVSDSGPGINDIDRAMQVGFSTATKEVREMGFGAGMGLPNIKKNSDSFHIESVPGEGTVLTLVNKLTN